MTASIPLAWLGTYLIHSTLLLGAAWAASRLLRGRRSDTALALEESLWKGALVGGLLTATLQVGLGVAAPAPTLAGTPRLALADAAGATIGAPAEPGPAAAGEAPDDPLGAGLSLATTGAPYPLLATPAGLLPGWQRLALAVWLLGALAGAAWLAGTWARLRRVLRRRTEIADGPSRHLLDRLVSASRARRPVRLTGSGRLPVPVALGVLEREICLPRRALDALGPRRQNGLLAHELAHLERRDPAWLLASRAIESLLFVQPLNRLARSRLQQIAELRCDAWAVERTGDRAALARCLTEVAHWLTGGVGEAGWPAPAWSQLPSMASDPKGLGLRVRRILEAAPESDGNARAARRWSLALPAVLLVAVAGFAPGVTPILPDAPAAEAAPAADAAPVAEDGSALGQEQGRADDGDREKAAPAVQETGEADEARDAREARSGERDRRDDRSVDRQAEREADRQAREDVDRELRERLHEQLRAVEEAQGEVDSEVERAMAENREALQQLYQRLAAELAAAGDLHDLSPEARAQLEEEVRRMSERAERIAERARPSQEELDRLQAEALRLSREAMENPEEIERLSREAERLERETTRMTRSMERTSDEQLRRVEEEADRLQAAVERQVKSAEREELEQHAEALRAQGQSLEAQRRQLERQMKALEHRRQELEQRFEEQRQAQERAMDAHQRELDARRRELEERYHAMLRELEEQKQQAAESLKSAEEPSAVEEEPSAAEAHEPPR